MMNRIIPFFTKHPWILTFFLLSVATAFSGLFFISVDTPHNSANIALVYTLALVCIGRWTSRYRYGISAAVFSVIAINYFFTYPYWNINFSLSGYPITFVGMFTLSIITSATTIHMKKQSKSLSENQLALLEADKEKMRANLLRAVSHDLRTPLTGIIGAASAYKEHQDTYSSKEKDELIQNIYTDANWLLHMVENLLTVTRIQNDCQKVSTSPEVIDEVVAEAILRFKKRYPHAEVNASTPPDFLMVPMDAMLIEQVIINLLENALVHSQSTEPSLILVESLDQEVVFHIYDYGIGIEEHHLPTIFDGTGETPTATNLRKGMGIGLSICKTIILAHNGTISARNHENGAEFYFTLPKEESL